MQRAGGGKPKCSYNPGWGFSDFSFESLWVRSSVLHFFPQPRVNVSPALFPSTWNLLDSRLETGRRLLACPPACLWQTPLQGPSPRGAPVLSQWEALLLV